MVKSSTYADKKKRIQCISRAKLREDVEVCDTDPIPGSRIVSYGNVRLGQRRAPSADNNVALIFNRRSLDAPVALRPARRSATPTYIVFP